MAQDSPAPHSPPEVPKRPKGELLLFPALSMTRRRNLGILKNSNSYRHTSPEANVSPTSERPPPPPPANNNAADGVSRPPMPPRELSEKELTQMNTEMNAGAHRRTSSNPQSSISRRQSGASNADAMHDEHGQRLKWDEANLYLNEGQMGGRMKIDEPKTPYAKQYDPIEDEEEMSGLNAQELAVDELDMENGKQPPKKTSKDSDIPGLDLGDPEMDPKVRRDSDGERMVVVESDDMDVDGGTHHGEQREEDMSLVDREKHKKFEEMRKKHYEMRNVKNLLGYVV